MSITIEEAQKINDALVELRHKVESVFDEAIEKIRAIEVGN